VKAVDVILIVFGPINVRFARHCSNLEVNLKTGYRELILGFGDSIIKRLIDDPQNILLDTKRLEVELRLMIESSNKECLRSGTFLLNSICRVTLISLSA
jgi:hypothetical protein